MAANAQLRIYRIHPGRMDEFLRVFHDHVVPARAAYGFTVVGAWIDRDDPDRFTWIPAYDGELGWDEADRRYYASPERAGIDPTPGSFIEEVIAAHVLVPAGEER